MESNCIEINKILKRLSKEFIIDELTYLMSLIDNDDVYKILYKQHKKLYGEELSNKIKRLFYDK